MKYVAVCRRRFEFDRISTLRLEIPIRIKWRVLGNCVRKNGKCTIKHVFEDVAREFAAARAHFM